MSILLFPYLSNTFMIITSIILGIALSAAIFIPLNKKDQIFGFSIFCAFCIYMAFQVSPTPRQVDRMVITQWMQLDKNKVSSNGFRNTILMTCQKRGFLDGHSVDWAEEAFVKDIDSHLAKGSGSKDTLAYFQFYSDVPEEAKMYKDACKFANENYSKSSSF